MNYFLFLVLFSVTLFSSEIKSNVSYFEQKEIHKSSNITEEKFLPLKPKYSNFGFTKSTYWLKVEIDNSSSGSSREVLHLPYTLLDYIDIYEFEDNRLILKREYGDLRPYTNDGNIPDPSFIITLDSNESKTFFYKISTQGSMNIELLISSYDVYTKYSLEKSIVFSFYFGALFIMLIYNFILYLYLKDKSYFYYILFHLNYLFFSLSLNGFTFSYIWPQTPYLNNYIVPLLMSIGSSIAVLFTIEFLNIKNSSPKLFKSLKALFWANVIMSTLVLVLSYRLSSSLASLLSILSIVIILGSSIYSHFSSRNPYAKFFALAWGSLLMGIFVIHFRNIGFLPVNFFTSYSPLIGAFIELTLLAIVLSYRYNIQQEELVAKDTILFKQSRLASMGEMVSNIAHQWRQPLNRINLSLAVMKNVLQEENINNEIINQKIKNSEKNIHYMSQTIDDFTNFFAPDKRVSNFNIYRIVQKSLTLLESRLKGVEVRMPIDRNIKLYGYENEFIQVILVILNNAVDNFEIKEIKNRDIFISIYQDKDSSTLSITDNGGGIDKKDIDYIFDPYFSTKFKKEGTGIGLYMAKMLIENSMNGELKVVSEYSTTKFEIKLWRSNDE